MRIRHPALGGAICLVLGIASGFREFGVFLRYFTLWWRYTPNENKVSTFFSQRTAQAQQSWITIPPSLIFWFLVLVLGLWSWALDLYWLDFILNLGFVLCKVVLSTSSLKEQRVN